MNYNLESFCPEVWSSLEIDAEGDFKVCCLANFDDDFGMARDDDDKVMNILTHSLEEAINSKTHREHRVDLANNIQPKRCRNCYDSEEATRGKSDQWPDGQSKRQGLIRLNCAVIPEYATIEMVKNITDIKGVVSTPKIVSLDLRFGNLCNQKCIMCSPQHSNQWYSDWAALYQEDFNPAVVYKGKYKKYLIQTDQRGKYQMAGMKKWWETDIWWEKFDKIAPDLKFLYFTGGEPLLVPAMQECLDRLIEKDFAKNITVKFDTNLSVINNKVIDKLKKFQRLLFCISVDEVGQDRYNLIRNPGNYDRLLENIETLKRNKIPIRWISSCIGIATPYAMIRVQELADQLNVESFFRFLEGPKWLDLRVLPPSAKKEIIETLRPYADRPGWHRWITSEIVLLEKYMEEENQRLIQKFVDNMDILDERRGTNWRTTLPDVFDLIKKHCDKVQL
jgi:organic radical activating enzyme